MLLSIFQSHDLIEPVEVSVNCVPAATQAGVWTKEAVGDIVIEMGFWMEALQPKFVVTVSPTEYDPAKE